MKEPAKCSWEELLDALLEEQEARAGGALALGGFDPWGELARRVRNSAGFIGRRLGLAEDDCLDIAQETALRLHGRLRELRSKESPLAYVLTIIRNLALEKAREQRRARAALARAAMQVVVEVEPVSGEDDLVRALDEELTGLTPAERDLLRLKFWKGMTTKEIAEQQGESYAAVAQRLVRLLHRLRARLEARRSRG